MKIIFTLFSIKVLKATKMFQFMPNLNTIEELCRRHECILMEKCCPHGSFHKTDKNMSRIKENIVSRSMKFGLHCVVK